jgi:hypothetical protein
MVSPIASSNLEISLQTPWNQNQSAQPRKTNPQTQGHSRVDRIMLPVLNLVGKEKLKCVDGPSSHTCGTITSKQLAARDK